MLARRIKRLFYQFSLGDQNFRFMFDSPPDDDVIVFDCETTGLDVAHDDIVTIAAVKIRGNRILASEKFEVIARPDAKMSAEAIKVHRLREADVEGGKLIFKVLPDFLHFVGGRPLVGYYLEFDVAMVDKYLLQLKGIGLPNPMVEVSQMYYERKYGDAPPGTVIDLSFKAILADLGIPPLDQHDALNDAMMTAMIYVTLKDMKERGVRIPRLREDARGVHGFGA
jgi:DNA polymerase-3 subunit epsilon